MGNGRTAEIERISLFVADYFYGVGVGDFGCVGDFFAQGGDAGVLVLCQVACDLVDCGYRDQWFVALYVDYDFLSAQAQ